MCFAEVTPFFEIAFTVSLKKNYVNEYDEIPCHTFITVLHYAK